MLLGAAATRLAEDISMPSTASVDAGDVYAASAEIYAAPDSYGLRPALGLESGLSLDFGDHGQPGASSDSRFALIFRRLDSEPLHSTSAAKHAELGKAVAAAAAAAEQARQLASAAHAAAGLAEKQRAGRYGRRGKKKVSRRGEPGRQPVGLPAMPAAGRRAVAGASS